LVNFGNFKPEGRKPPLLLNLIGKEKRQLLMVKNQLFLLNGDDGHYAL
jgi:hypothetical protein